jgi:hypothetical protein
MMSDLLLKIQEVDRKYCLRGFASGEVYCRWNYGAIEMKGQQIKGWKDDLEIGLGRNCLSVRKITSEAKNILGSNTVGWINTCDATALIQTLGQGGLIASLLSVL